MARFVVLDHSLTRVGGHHFEQATLILRAADATGRDCVLVTNRRFSQQHLLPTHWQVLSLFPDESYDCQADYPLNVEGRSLGLPAVEAIAADDAPGGSHRRTRVCWWRVRQRISNWRRRRRIMRFATACARTHEALDLREGDQVFIPTTSLFDLVGLVRFLQSPAAPQAVVWHVCFHYGFLQGREPEYAEQSVREGRIRQQLHYLVHHVPRSQLRFYATTDKLADQFNRLGISDFGVLPFPVDYRALEHSGPLASQPRQLRLTCAGYLRREKGKMWAGALVQGLWDSELAPGHVQLVVQTNQRQARRMLPRGEGALPQFRGSLQGVGREPIVWLKHPLSREAYLELIRESDIALFLHDGCAYYTRCSGVLVEMLAAGVPVLVPAGSWLADQVAEPIGVHLDSLAAQGTCLRDGPPRKVGWQYPGSARTTTELPHEFVVGGESREGLCEVVVPSSSSALLVSLRCQNERQSGTYLRIRANQYASRTETILALAAPAATCILSPRPTSDTVSTLVPLDPGTTCVHLHLQNAFDDSPVTITNTRISLLGRPRSGPASYPAGSVGLVFADIEQLPVLVQNMREHYGHFRQTAQHFARHWRQRHDAQQIVAALLDGAAELKAVA